MRETAKQLLAMPVEGENIKATLRRLGIADDDQNYQTAVVVSLMQSSMVDGNTSAIRLLGELSGDIGNGIMPIMDDDELEFEYPTIAIPENGRDEKEVLDLKPQAGPQTSFMTSPADIVIYGGAAGGGKTYALLMEMLRHKDVKGFGAVIFRRNFNQITNQGGLWDTAGDIYSKVKGAVPKKSPKLHWEFEDGAKISFAHIERDENLQSWQGSQIAYIGFDELTHFTKRQFFYMLSRNRSTCGIRPYMRATCNPDCDSWVADLIKWWIDQETGYPIPERGGRVRYMAVIDDIIYWGDSVEEVKEQHPAIEDINIKTFTFIPSRLEDNKILMKNDPGYKANLLTLGKVDTERLLYGNWKVKASAGTMFKRTQVKMLKQPPANVVAYCRAWDLAATDKKENDQAAFTSGVLIGVTDEGRFVVIDVINKQLEPGEVRKLIKMTATIDDTKYGNVTVRLPQDPGQAGKEQAKSYIKMLAGHTVKAIAESGDKVTRAEPMSAQWQNGFFDVVEGEWNEMYFNQLESFPESKFKDMVDAGSSAFIELAIYAENKLYKEFIDKVEELTLISDDVARTVSEKVNIGVSIGDRGISMVATSISESRGRVTVLKSERFDAISQEKALEESFLKFCEEVYVKYGSIDYAYTDAKESVINRMLKNVADRRNIPIRVRKAANHDVTNRIRLTNTLIAQEGFFVTEECSELIKAMSTASKGGKGSDIRSEESDVGMLNAFDYTIEREGSKLIRSK